MGGVCARCSDVEKGKQDGMASAQPADLDDLDASDADEEDGSEVVASSEGSVDEEAYKKDVQDTLANAGANLKRGKTMAMKEAISTAKKFNLDDKVITEAEKQLEDHKKQQRREAMEKECEEFMESKVSHEIPQVEKMLKKAADAECNPSVIQTLEDRLQLLIQTRPLEMEETEHAKEYMKKSCSDFVRLATKGGGRPVVFLNLEDGKKISATMTLSAPLQNLIMTFDDREEHLEVPVSSLQARVAAKDHTVQNSKGYSLLEEDDAECSVALKHKGGVWCIVEPTLIRRDRLVEAIVILVEACKFLGDTS